MHPVICLDPLFPGLPHHERVARVASAGFDRVEFWGWRSLDLPALRRACDARGVQVVNFSGHRVGSPVARATHGELLRDVAETVPVARALGCRTLMLLTNALGPDGQVLDAYAAIPDAAKREDTVAALRQVLATTPDDLQLVLEPLNTVLDHPGYWLSDMATAAAIVREVGSSRLKVLCDLYHMAMMGHPLERLIDAHVAHIGHVHVADVPGRHEPGTGAIDWLAVLRRLRDRGYAGNVGFEYFPAGDPEVSLRAVRRLWDAL